MPASFLRVCRLLHPYDRRCDCCCGNQNTVDVGWGLLLLCGSYSHHGTVWSPVIGAKAPRSGSKPWYEEVWAGLSLGKMPLHVLPQELSTRTCDAVITLWCYLHQCAHPQSPLLQVPWPISSMGATIISSGIFPANMHTSQSYRHRDLPQPRPPIPLWEH